MLKAYAEKFQVGPGWLFLTGKEANITLLRKKLGLYIDEIQNGTNDHNLSLIIGNQRTGRWMKRSPFENAYFLANQIGSWLHNWKTADSEQDSYANALEIRKLSMGENLFRTRCAACHTIGGGDITEADARPLGAELQKMGLDTRRVGPDLLGVTEMRDRAWLSRWLREPEKMLAEKDPIVMGLYAKYNNVPMPNMRLNEFEAERLLERIEKESRRVQKVRQNEAVLAAAKSGAAKKPCCLEKKGSLSNEGDGLVVDAGETPAVGETEGSVASFLTSPILIVGDDESAEPESRENRILTGSMIVSSGMGCVFLLLAVVVRRRSSMSKNI